MEEGVLAASLEAAKERWGGWSFWERCTLILVVLVVVAQIDFFVRDGRIPRDPGRYYLQTLWYYWALEDPLQWPVALWYAATNGTGWFHLLLALLSRVFGRWPFIFEALEVLFTASIVASTAVIARRFFDDRVAFLAACFTATSPLVYLQARFGWIHVPEAALLLLLFERYTADPKLSRRSTVTWVAVTGTLAVLLRESGMVWVGLMVPLVTYGSRSAEVSQWPLSRRLFSTDGLPMRSLVAIAVPWGLAASVHIAGITAYMDAKDAAYERYVLDVPGLGEQLQFAYGNPQHWLVELGLVLAVGAALVQLWKKGPGALRSLDGPTLLLCAWGLVPFALYVRFRAGVDNFNHVAAVIAIAAAVVLARLPYGPWLGIPGLIIAFVLPVLPMSLTTPLASVGIESGTYGIKDFRRANGHAFGALTVAALLDASCPEPDGWLSCHVITQQGLFYPTSEELGYLELFQLREDRVYLRGVNEKPPSLGWQGWGVHAMAIWNCPGDTTPWLRRHPDAEMAAAQIAGELNLQQAWASDVGPSCTLHWFTPGGTFNKPLLAPDASGPSRSWTPAMAYQYNVAFLQQLGGYREGHVSALLYGVPPQGEQPPSSVVENGVEHRVLKARHQNLFQR